MSSPASSPATKSKVMRITLRKTVDCKRMGINYHYNQTETCVVIESVGDGLVSRWNMDHPSMLVRPNDIIMACNGKRGDANEIMDALQDDQSLEVEVLSNQDNQVYVGAPVPATLYATIHGNGKIKRRSCHFRAIYRNKAYYVGRNLHIFYAEKNWYGEKFVMAKLPPNTPEPHIFARCSANKDLLPPEAGWDSDKYDEVSLSVKKPSDWTEGETNEAKEKMGKLCAVLKKSQGKDGEFYISIRDICRNIEAVRQFLPELLTEFPKIDADGNGKVTLDELEKYFDPQTRKEYGADKLEEIWNILLSKRKDESKSKDVLDLEDMSTQLEYIDEKIPALFEYFQDVDLNRSCSIERDEFDAYFGSADAWLKTKLRNIIGLEELKTQVNEFYWQQRLDRLRRRGGCMVSSEQSIVIMFKGSPGTGKTTIGRLLAGLLQKIDVIPTDTFVECQRDDLVGDHIGATEKLTQKKINEAKGGVLFVDEAYRLSSDVFGVEAINSLMRAMTEKGTVMILAGYPKQMDEFTASNPGLKRRITYEMEFPDYTPDDLAKILMTQIRKRGFSCSVEHAKLTDMIDKATTPGQRTCFNGGIGEHITRHAIFNLNRREIPNIQGKKKGEEPTPSIELSVEDIGEGCKHIPLEPPPIEFKKPVASSKVSTS